ncbi:hypothetical protein A9Q87_05395 [Flavobacteriales bacterium 34_180_T64]|nr:hypothetical protein A9Q87_05395 [Flavobacteriales bacterium 34_180_T64]
MNALDIRKATINDAEIIALLARVTFRESFGYLFSNQQDLIDYFEHTFSVDKIKNGIQKKNNVFWLALLNELPVGYAKLKKHSTTEFLDQTHQISQLQKIYILNDFLGQHIGQQLQDAIFDEVRTLKSTHLWLSVYNGNPKAISFYKRHGFTSIGTHNFSIGKETFEFTVMDKPF